MKRSLTKFGATFAFVGIGIAGALVATHVLLAMQPQSGWRKTAGRDSTRAGPHSLR